MPPWRLLTWSVMLPEVSSQGFNLDGWRPSYPPCSEGAESVLGLGLPRYREVAATIHVLRAVNSQADQPGHKAMATRDSEEGPCEYVDPLALSVSAGLGAFWEGSG